MYYLKNSAIAIIYSLFSAMIAIGIDLWESAPKWLLTVLAIVNLALYAYIVFSIASRSGGDAVKIRKGNDINRIKVIETGDDLPINRQAEYAHYKGFIIGVFACLPLLILMGAHLIAMLVGTMDFFGLLAVLLVKSVTVFFTIGGMSLAGYTCFYSLIFLPFTALVIGLGYIFGAIKQQRVYDSIKNLNADGE